MIIHDLILEELEAFPLIKIQVETASGEARNGQIIYMHLYDNIWYYGERKYKWVAPGILPSFARGVNVLYAADVYPCPQNPSDRMVIEFEDNGGNDVTPRIGWLVLIDEEGEDDKLSEAGTPTASRA
jgi:hypothetical protein